jgi:ATP-dependent exoDNAse (exonuclease V) alpha subunit
MQVRSPDARQLPPAHLTIRVPWHDAGWDGTVCRDPAANTSCLILGRVANDRDDAQEQRTVGRHLSVLAPAERPACAAERGSIMSPTAWTRAVRHPYAVSSPETHGHFDETNFEHPAWSAACVPFRWMLKKNVEGDAEAGTQGLCNELKLGYQREREPPLKFATSWVQARDNQLAVLDTFFSAIEPRASLCFFYAKRTPLVDDPRRVLVGVGRVLGVGEAVEYRYKVPNPAVRCVLWDRNVVHSIRPGFEDGFLLPYREILALAQQDESLRPEEYAVFAPDEYFDQYSYASELLPHDGAIASLVACASVLRRIKERVPGSWDASLAWIDRELNRLWKARGAFPGLGSALTAFGLEQGNLIAYAIASAQASAQREWTEDPWDLVDAVFEDPNVLPGVTAGIGPTWGAKWKKLAPERRALLKLVSRFALSADQALRFFQPTEREKAGIVATDAELLANPYLLYELDRRSPDPIALGVVDRGMFPDPQIRTAFPVPAPSRVEEDIDPRRARALVVDTLETAATEGHTLLPRAWTIQRIRERPLEPGCPLDDDALAVTEGSFAPVVLAVTLAAGRPALQLERLVATREIIREAVRRRLKAPRHASAHDWAGLVDAGLGAALLSDEVERGAEDRARAEKTAALQEIYEARVSVLIGPAGTGKTTLLRVLCGLPDIQQGRILLLAPTGKARVRLEQQTKRKGEGQTLAQFLLKWQRYDGSSNRYFPNPKGGKCADARTVIVDECSMLTEEQLAALLDALGPVDRIVLVGDPRQLPPIGAGRPFVDLVRDLAPAEVETQFPRRAKGYAELTITRRQLGANRDDLLLAAHFSGRPLDAGADEVWDRIAGGTTETVRVVQWTDAGDLHEKLVAELARELSLGSPLEEARFEQSIGGTPFGDGGQMFFWPGKDGQPGAARSVDAWQILDPVRGSPHGVEALNRVIQERLRTRARSMAGQAKFYLRKIPKPLGPQGILWGDKVINLRNSGRRRTWPVTQGTYLANGDVGVAVGEYKTKNQKFLPENLEVEFGTHPGLSFKYWKSEFSGDEAEPQLELAYTLTIHKVQGSEFGVTFVVLPNPCRLLSRELLYTALTRHQRKVVVLHQGPLVQLRRYSDERASEVARRLTNLFRDAAPREFTVGNETRFLDDGLIHRTERGELVRSKSEVVIADKLHARKIVYAYEAPVMLADGTERYPDFTIVDDVTGVRFYWEHLGMLGDPDYAIRWARKLAAYRASGILPNEEGGGPQGTLVTTRDDPGGALDSAKIARLIDEVIRGE